MAGTKIIDCRAKQEFFIIAVGLYACGLLLYIIVLYTYYTIRNIKDLRDVPVAVCSAGAGFLMQGQKVKCCRILPFGLFSAVFL